jgi:hypothetical protein
MEQFPRLVVLRQTREWSPTRHMPHSLWLSKGPSRAPDLDGLETIDRQDATEAPGAEVFEATLNEAKRVCNLY